MGMKEEIEKTIKGNTVVMYSKTFCPHCKRAKAELNKLDIKYEAIELDEKFKPDDMAAMQDTLRDMTGARSVPRVFIKGECIGGADDTLALAKTGELQKRVQA